MSYHPGVHATPKRAGLLAIIFALAMIIVLWAVAAYILARIVW